MVSFNGFACVICLISRCGYVYMLLDHPMHVLVSAYIFSHVPNMCYVHDP